MEEIEDAVGKDYWTRRRAPPLFRRVQREETRLQWCAAQIGPEILGRNLSTTGP